MLRLSLFAFASVQVATRLTATPTSATISTALPPTSGGVMSRRQASNTISSAEHQQRDAVRLRREDLDAPEAVRHDALARAAPRA